MNEEKKQEEQVMDYIRVNGSITSLQAVIDLRILRLAAVIYNLRDAGINIKDAWEYEYTVTVDKRGHKCQKVSKKWKVYWI